MGLIDTVKNNVLNIMGVERDLIQLIKDKDISKAKTLFSDNSSRVEVALNEYDTEKHAVMNRANKPRKAKEDYMTAKLPRGWQVYINEIALFFLFGRPVKWMNKSSDNEGLNNTFKEYRAFLEKTHFDTTTRQVKRLAGAETEAAKLYHIYKDVDNEIRVRVIVMSKSKGYELRPLKNQYEDLVAFGVGYKLNVDGKAEERFDIHTSKYIYQCRKVSLGWEVNTVNNPTGKINIIYYEQEREWRSAQRRIERDEMLDSRAADTNDYFGDPVAKATADVVNNLASPDQVGKLVIMSGQDSVFDYISPPEGVELKEFEKKSLRESILMDTFTPDFTYEGLKGAGTLSGEALKRALTLGFIKRDLNKEIYEPMLRREKNLILTIMQKVTNPGLPYDGLDIGFDFGEPFSYDDKEYVDRVCRQYEAGVMALDTAVALLSNVSDVKGEVEKIKNEKSEPVVQ